MALSCGLQARVDLSRVGCPVTSDAHKWTFERINPDASGTSGKISDLFRNEGVDQRGHLAVDAPAPAATLMAREVIQNSWDAAQELRMDPDYPAVPPFYMDFHFKRSEGEVK